MLKVLLKKQFYECFKGYFVNQKTNQKRSKGSMIALFSLFAFLMLFLCAIFFGLAYSFAVTILNIGIDWFYFSLMGLMALLLGVFGSVFNTYATLYLAKDNDLLLSMPIPPSVILTTRISLVYGLSLLYSSLVWLPTVVCYFIFAKLTLLSVIFSVLLTFIIPLFITFITCVLGYLVAIIASKAKKKSLVTVIISLLFFAVYYIFCFKSSEIFSSIIENAESVSNGFKTYGNIVYLLGTSASGNALSMLCFTAITVALFALCFLILSKTFIKTVTRSTGSKKSNTAKKVEVKNKTVFQALLGREFKRFLSSATYLLNTGIGLFIMLAVAVIIAIKGNSINEFITLIQNEDPNLMGLVAIFPLFLVGFIGGMNVISTPSVSLEGKNLWILRTMPVSGTQILKAKYYLHYIVTGAFSVVSCLIMNIVLKSSVTVIILELLICLNISSFTGLFGLVLGVKKPNFNWTNEAYPIKQSMNILVSMLINILYVLVITVPYVILTVVVDSIYVNVSFAETYLIMAFVVTTVCNGFIKKWLYTTGGELFDNF